MALKQTSLGVIDKMSRAELKRAIVTCFEYSPDATPIDRLAVLQEAEFYTRELERRADSRTSIRDLILEIVVILLIGGEILLGYRQGRDEANASALEQQVLTNLQTSSAATVSTLQTLQKTTEDMNKSIQVEVGLNYDVAVEITFDDPSKRIYATNKGRTNIFLWGAKTDTQKAVIENKGRMIAPGGTYAIAGEALYAEIQQKLPKGLDKTLPFVLFVKNENGNEFLIEAQLFCIWHNDVLTIHTQTLSVKRGKWTGKDN